MTTNDSPQESPQPVDRITEVSATVDAGLSQEDVDGMNEAERLALIVGAAYGAALAERDDAQRQVAVLEDRLAEAKALLDYAVAHWPETTWATDTKAQDRLVQGIGTLWPVDSDQTPTQET